MLFFTPRFCYFEIIEVIHLRRKHFAGFASYLLILFQEWIHENDVLSIVLKDNLHQPQVGFSKCECVRTRAVLSILCSLLLFLNHSP